MYNNQGTSNKPQDTSSPVDSELSKRIKSLRFLLIVFIVFIHNTVSEIQFAGKTETYAVPGYVNVIKELISSYIAGVAIPLFALISGYLLYAKETKLITVLKKKSKAILLPYILWNILAIIFFYTAQRFSFTKPYFANIIIKNFGIMDWLGAFGFLKSPLVGQFWFMRDLFILCMLFLVIKKIIDLFPFGTLVLLLILWTKDIPIYFVSTEVLLFFALGYYIVKYSADYKKLDKIKMYDVVATYLITIVFGLFISKRVRLIYCLDIIVGCVFFIKLTYYFIKNKRLYAKLAWLEKYTFFVYAVHEIPLVTLRKLSVKIIPMHGGWLLLQYFGVSVLGIILFVAMGVAVKKLSPKLYGILTGGRT